MMATTLYTIIETDSGPIISDSRVTVFDVLEALQIGRSTYEICVIHNLTPLQVEVAFSYIATHRAALEAELSDIQARKAERAADARASAAERQKQIDQLPITTRRAEFYALRERNRLIANGGDTPHATDPE